MYSHSSVLKTKLGSSEYFFMKRSNHLSIVLRGTTNSPSAAAFSFYFNQLSRSYPIKALQVIEEVICDFFRKLLVEILCLLDSNDCLYVSEWLQLDHQLDLGEDVHRWIQRPACMEYVARSLISDGSNKLEVLIRVC